MDDLVREKDAIIKQVSAGVWGAEGVEGAERQQQVR